MKPLSSSGKHHQAPDVPFLELISEETLTRFIMFLEKELNWAVLGIQRKCQACNRIDGAMRWACIKCGGDTVPFADFTEPIASLREALAYSLKLTPKTFPWEQPPSVQEVKITLPPVPQPSPKSLSDLPESPL